MFVGHLAVALAAKPVVPRVSLGTLVGAAFALDLLWPLMLLTGFERVEIQPGNTAFTPLAFESYPWTHSLLFAAIWGAVLALLTARALRPALVIAAVVVSHWVLDFATHRPDLPLWPGSAKVGLGLWNSIPLTFVIEGALLVGALALYTRDTRARNARGRWTLWTLVGLCTVIWISGPFSPPPPGAGAVAVVGLAMWLFPFWGAWIDRNRRPLFG